MKKRHLLFLAGVMCLTLIMAGSPRGSMKDDLCSRVDAKPTLNLQQINEAEMIHFIYAMTGRELPEGYEDMSAEELYKVEVQALIDAGFPASFADIEPDRLVSRRHVAAIMFQVACMVDPAFAEQYGSLTDEKDQMQALADTDWLQAQEGRVYRDEILSVLCTHEDDFEKLPPVVVTIVTPDLNPPGEEIVVPPIDGNPEEPSSGI